MENLKVNQLNYRLIPCDFAESLTPGDKLIFGYPAEYKQPPQFIIIKEVFNDHIHFYHTSYCSDYVFKSLTRKFIIDEGYVKVDEFPAVNGQIFNWEESKWEFLE